MHLAAPFFAKPIDTGAQCSDTEGKTGLFQELDVSLLYCAILEACCACSCPEYVLMDIPHRWPAKYGMNVVLLDTRRILTSGQHLVDDADGISTASEVHFTARVCVQHQHMHNKLRAFFNSELRFFSDAHGQVIRCT